MKKEFLSAMAGLLFGYFSYNTALAEAPKLTGGNISDENKISCAQLGSEYKAKGIVNGQLKCVKEGTVVESLVPCPEGKGKASQLEANGTALCVVAEGAGEKKLEAASLESKVCPLNGEYEMTIPKGSNPFNQLRDLFWGCYGPTTNTERKLVGTPKKDDGAVDRFVVWYAGQNCAKVDECYTAGLKKARGIKAGEKFTLSFSNDQLTEVNGEPWNKYVKGAVEEEKPAAVEISYTVGDLVIKDKDGKEVELGKGLTLPTGEYTFDSKEDDDLIYVGSVSELGADATAETAKGKLTEDKIKEIIGKAKDSFPLTLGKGDYFAFITDTQAKDKPLEQVLAKFEVMTGKEVVEEKKPEVVIPRVVIYSANPFITGRPGEKGFDVGLTYGSSRIDRPVSGGKKVRIDLDNLALDAIYRHFLKNGNLTPFLEANGLVSRETGKLRFEGGEGDIESNKVYVGGGAGLNYKGEKWQGELSGRGAILLTQANRTTINLPFGMLKSERSFSNDYRWEVEGRLACRPITLEVLASHNQSTEEQANSLDTGSEAVGAKSDVRDSHLGVLGRYDKPLVGKWMAYPILGIDLSKYTFNTAGHGREYNDLNLVLGGDLVYNFGTLRPKVTYHTQTGQVGLGLEAVLGADKNVRLGAEWQYAPVIGKTERENQKVPVGGAYLRLNF